MSTTDLSTAMETIQQKAEQKAGGDSPPDSPETEDEASSDAPHESSDAPRASREEEGDDIQEPDAVDEKALRWGRYVVEHIEPQEGDVFLIKGPTGEKAQEHRAMMAEALKRILAEKGIETYQIIRGPSHKVSIAQISDEQMRELGYVRKTDANFPGTD